MPRLGSIKAVERSVTTAAMLLSLLKAAGLLPASRLPVSAFPFWAITGNEDLKWDTHDMMLQPEDELHGVQARS